MGVEDPGGVGVEDLGDVHLVLRVRHGGSAGEAQYKLIRGSCCGSTGSGLGVGAGGWDEG